MQLQLCADRAICAVAITEKSPNLQKLGLPSVKEELRYKYSHMHALLRAGLIIAMAIQMIVRKRSMHKRKDINRDIIL